MKGLRKSDWNCIRFSYNTGCLMLLCIFRLLCIIISWTERVTIWQSLISAASFEMQSLLKFMFIFWVLNFRFSFSDWSESHNIKELHSRGNHCPKSCQRIYSSGFSVSFTNIMGVVRHRDASSQLRKMFTANFWLLPPHLKKYPSKYKKRHP